MRLHGESILLFPADPVFAREDLGGFAHVQSADRIGEAELQGDARLEIGGTELGERGEFFQNGLRPGECRHIFSPPSA